MRGDCIREAPWCTASLLLYYRIFIFICLVFFFFFNRIILFYEFFPQTKLGKVTMGFPYSLWEKKSFSCPTKHILFLLLNRINLILVSRWNISSGYLSCGVGERKPNSYFIVDFWVVICICIWFVCCAWVWVSL